MPTLTALIASAAVLISPAAADAGAPSARPIGTSVGAELERGQYATPPAGLVSDGRRYFAYKPNARQIRIVDTRTGRSRLVAVAERCAPVDAAEGRLLLSCQDPADPTGTQLLGPQLVTLRSGRVTDVRQPGLSVDFYLVLGRHWLRGVRDEPAGPRPVYLNWRTGRFLEERGDTRRARDIADPDLPVLGTTWASVDRSHGTSAPYTLLEGRFSGRTSSRPLVLTRRGGGRRTLSRCANGPCAAAWLSHGIATWREGSLAFAYDLSERRRFRWRFRTVGRGRRTNDLQVVHTATAVVFAAARRTAGSYTLYRARLSDK